MDDRTLTRRQQRQQERVEARELEQRTSPEQWLLLRSIPWAATVGLFVGMRFVADDPGALAPAFIIGLAWGSGLIRGYVRRRQQRSLGLSGTASPQTPLQVADVALPEPTNGTLAADVRRVVAGLRTHGRGRVADTVERGFIEVERLSKLAGSGRRADELRTEIVDLQARAAATSDPEAAALWGQNVRAAERRLLKVLALDAATERTEARIEAYRQTIKSLAVDLARLDLAGPSTADLPAVDEHAAAVEREVEALTRAHEELARLEHGEATNEPGRSVAAAAQRASEGVVR